MAPIATRHHRGGSLGEGGDSWYGGGGGHGRERWEEEERRGASGQAGKEVVEMERAPHY
jgi:hypothetical protein